MSKHQFLFYITYVTWIMVPSSSISITVMSMQLEIFYEFWWADSPVLQEYEQKKFLNRVETRLKCTCSAALGASFHNLLPYPLLAEVTILIIHMVFEIVL